jgi:hypothetical protein
MSIYIYEYIHVGAPRESHAGSMLCICPRTTIDMYAHTAIYVSSGAPRASHGAS